MNIASCKMAKVLAILVFFTSIHSPVASTPFHRRQNAPTSLEQYISQVRTALYVIDSLKAGNETTSCSDSDFADKLGTAGYDGEYAQRLLYVFNYNLLSIQEY